MTLGYLDYAAATVAIYLLGRWASKKRSHGAPLPPGPSGLPIIGSLLAWPKDQEWITFSKWAKQYGDIVHVELAGKHVVILNHPSVAQEMLDRKGSIYSDRPVLTFASMAGFGDALTLVSEGPEFKLQRKVFAQELGSKATLARFSSMTFAQTQRFIRNILREPSANKISQHIQNLAGSTILNVAYGYQAKEGYDEYIDLVGRALNNFSAAAAPGAHAVDTLSWLEKLPRWLPGMGWKQVAEDYLVTTHDFLNVPYEYVLQQRAEGTARPSVVNDYLEKRGSLSPEEEHQLKWAAAVIYGGGSDTTLSSIYGFFLYMCLYPDVQAKAQAEIDALLAGEHRLPTHDDRTKLPYVDALVKEVFRCGTVVRQGVPHRVRVDDVHDGYFIPKDTTIIANIWFMCHDPRTYKNPEVFNPERFLGEHPEPDPHTLVFGFGRRVCPGRLFADNTVYLACAMALATFSITKAKDASGKEITPPIDYHGSIIAHPTEFPCSVTPRSDKAEALANADSHFE